MTRSLMVMAVLLVVAFMAGWFSINRDGERTTIEINRDEIRSDARQAIDSGKDYWEQRRIQQAEADHYAQQAQQNGVQPTPWGNPYPNQYPADQYPNNQVSGYPPSAPVNPNATPAANPWNAPPPSTYPAATPGYPPGQYTPPPQQATPAWPQNGNY